MGAWWLYSVAAVYGHVPFETLYRGLPLLVVGAVVVLVRPWEAAPSPTPTTPHPRLPWLLGPAALGLGAWFGLELPFVVAWAPLAFAAVAAAGTAGPARGLQPPEATRLDLVSVTLAAIAFAVVVSGTHRFEVDDAYHINAMISTLRHPELPVLSFDGLHGDIRAPIQQLIHRPQTYEVFVAALARLTGEDPRVVYWLQLPVLLAVLVVLSTWRLLKLLDRRTAWLAIWFVFLVWTAWGDDYRAYGAYTYPRLFQGKPFFILFFVPAILTSAARFASRPTWGAFGVLTLTQCAAVTWTSSALVLSPVVAGIGLLSQLNLTRRSMQASVVGLFASAPLILSLVLTKLEVRAVGGLRHDGWIRDASAVLGTTERAPLALFALAVVPVLAVWARRDGGVWTARLSALFLLLVFNGFTAPFLAANVAELFSWRLYWTVPLPLWFALALTLGLAAAWERGPWPRRLAFVVLVALAGHTFWNAGRQVHNRGRVSWRWLRPKLPFNFHRLAKQTADMTEPTDLVAVAPRIAERLVGLDERPFITSVRQSYLTNLSRHWSPEETAGRQLLLDYLDTPEGLADPTPALDQLDAWCVKVVVTKRNPIAVRKARRDLIERGYYPAARRAGHQMYVHPREDCVPTGPASILDLRLQDEVEP